MPSVQKRRHAPFPTPEIGIEEIGQLEEKAYAVIESLRATAFAPGREKQLGLRFSITAAANMVGRSATAIRDAEKSGRLPPPAVDERNRRTGYTLSDINRMRAYFGTLPWRAPDEEPVILAIQNFKGGVGKSTIACHTAQYLALQGYRVCLIDCDSQASSTTMFGLNPDLDLHQEDTLHPFLMLGGQQTLQYALRKTYWDGIWLIPANLALYNAEYELAAQVHGNPLLFNRLREGIDTVKDAFDVIIIDPPPALGMISLSVLRAANAMIIPIPPSTVDFSSTTHFLSMLREALEILDSYGIRAQYKFLKAIASKVQDNKSTHTEISRLMAAVFGDFMIDTKLKDSAEIDNANAKLMTVYELPAPQTSRETFNRCKAYLNAANREIEILIRKTWPSHHEELRQMGVI
ncbi:Chromosome partitioning protein (plasmid) [Candidatus Methylocalor cossyra]|uniref:Chromosome partitioning protein n=2 Tax=Candidatus Methylocalor cossyra TaxID=3108543 RepID=A0ABM9NN79_9GAMM